MLYDTGRERATNMAESQHRRRLCDPCNGLSGARDPGKKKVGIWKVCYRSGGRNIYNDTVRFSPGSGN